jgi:hypothetical protein
MTVNVRAMPVIKKYYGGGAFRNFLAHQEVQTDEEE